MSDKKESKKRLRQARETSDGSVDVLCFACRRTADTTKQMGLAAFFAKPAARAEQAATSNGDTPLTTQLQCSKCKRPMDKHKLAARGGNGGAPSSSGSRVLPQIARLRQYQRLSAEQGMAFAMQESAATALMREPCIACGVPAPTEGHGLTRLRVWPDGLSRPARGGFMGPFHSSNVAACCGTCNLMKGYRRVRGFVEAARHIATHRARAASGEDFGLYPHRFRNNISKRSRSGYISASSTHTKTHAMSNETFNRITARPCRYCGKPSDPPRHYNGLDRLDSACRVYTEATCDSCCGDCNMMKYTYTEAFFIAHCVAVARHNVGVTSWPGDAADDDDDPEDAGDEGQDEPGGECAEAADEAPSHTQPRPTMLAWDSWEDDEHDALLDDELAEHAPEGTEGFGGSLAPSGLADGAAGHATSPPAPAATANPFAAFEFRETG